MDFSKLLVDSLDSVIKALREDDPAFGRAVDAELDGQSIAAELCLKRAASDDTQDDDQEMESTADYGSDSDQDDDGEHDNDVINKQRKTKSVTAASRTCE